MFNGFYPVQKQKQREKWKQVLVLQKETAQAGQISLFLNNIWYGTYRRDRLPVALQMFLITITLDQSLLAGSNGWEQRLTSGMVPPFPVI